ncbi:TSUP family transporter [Methylicorpusculum oleiharenae]|uniref:TSUP family transporter n=1 Tax=Methylicorpusculum oleiharenae TaxID=1338687 RepID=UPI00135C53F7|nr:TSUP family transporter [Methylicorpusculum oleiharenae]MCD2449027.1 TSUP family transporter [Methylicorpusculum oleiharenae]
MFVEVMLTVVATSIIQSVFGAGVLLFGTPLLLLFGYEFVDVLTILLPISIAINLLQILKDHTQIDFVFYRNIAILTLPFIAVFLFLVTHARINISFLIGGFLLFIAFKEFLPSVARIIDGMMKYETPYFIIMGIVHGVSNLGGSLLTAMIHHKKYQKDVARVTVATSYCTFALIQLLTLALFSKQQIDLSINQTGIYAIVGVLVFMFSDEVLYTQIDREKYQRIFAGFLAISGVVLMLRSMV